ncbi:MAG: hypothetical protein HQK81_10800 [Desulfovibrionaceae bacterium]|nr:hypothetical protein [Desulfovibrionaceae bacterium]MBF0514530.1 hypothetical protein [Desulfovibrionaceae bacterium]
MEDKYVRVMCDFCADGVWSKEGAICSDELPITADLAEKLRDWNWLYDLWYDDEDRSSWVADGFGPDEFTATGLELAKEIKRQLPDWEVVFHDEMAWDRAAALEYKTGEKQDLDGERFEFAIE